MGICWSRLAGKSTQAPVAAPAGSIPASAQFPDPDPAPSSIVNLFEGDASFVGNTGNSWFSMATTNFTSWMSQASGAIAAIWGDDNEFPVALEPDDEDLPDGGTIADSQLIAFTFEQLKATTFNFRSDMMLGKGGFGSVYKGWLKEKLPSKGNRKRPIAVKKLDSSSKQGVRQWKTEVGFLARLSHPNVVKLLGYCRENEECLIVYEFMQKGSLNYHLFGKGSNRQLPWETRLKIAVEMAQGLSYLHTLEKPIIFRDFKSSNILLDESYNAKISDFGLAKWGPIDDHMFITGHLMGTKGYADPCYISRGTLYVKSDCYSFGIVLLEMLTGLRAFDKRRPQAQQSLVDWYSALPASRRRVRQVMDSRLEGKYSPKQASKIFVLAVRCLEREPLHRPSMKEVAETLEQIQARE